MGLGILGYFPDFYTLSSAQGDLRMSRTFTTICTRSEQYRSKNQAVIFTDSTGSKWSVRISSASTFYNWGKYFPANSLNSVQNQKSGQSAFVYASDSLLMHSSTFWSLFIFCWHSTWEPASVRCDSWQGDLFCSSGPHGKQHCHN